MGLDVLIALVLLLSLFIGYQQGVLQPLLVEIFFFGALLIILHDRQSFSTGLEHYLHVTNAVIVVFTAIVIAIAAGYIGGLIGFHLHRMPVVRGVDGFLGIFVHFLVGLVAVYLVVSALVVMGKAFGPTTKSPTLSAAQVEQFRKTMDSNTITTGLVDPRDMKKLQAQAKAPGGARLESVNQVQQEQTLYTQVLDPQLRESRLASYVLTIGVHIPAIGKVGPGDLQQAESPKPSPSPSATAPKR